MNYVVRDPLKLTTEALLHPSGVDGVFARTAVFERVVDGLNLLISRHRAPDIEVLRFPPVMSRAHIQKSGYLGSFPNLLGAVCCLHGSETEIRGAVEGDKVEGAWTGALDATDLVLTPAACYPLYPLVAARGRVPDAGLVFDVAPARGPVAVVPAGALGSTGGGRPNRLGDEPHELREWRRGDTLRQVHWRATARRDRLTVVVPENTVRSRVALVILGVPGRSCRCSAPRPGPPSRSFAPTASCGCRRSAIRTTSATTPAPSSTGSPHSAPSSPARRCC